MVVLTGFLGIRNEFPGISLQIPAVLLWFIVILTQMPGVLSADMARVIR
jgi:hypothetical protein